MFPDSTGMLMAPFKSVKFDTIDTGDTEDLPGSSVSPLLPNRCQDYTALPGGKFLVREMLGHKW